MTPENILLNVNQDVITCKFCPPSLLWQYNFISSCFLFLLLFWLTKGDSVIVRRVGKTFHPRKSNSHRVTWFIDYSVCLFGAFRPIREFPLIWRRPHSGRRAANFDLCSALMAIEQWGFFSVPHLLWHWASIYNGDPWGPVTLTPIAEHLAKELSLPVITNLVCCSWDLNTKPSAWRVNAVSDCTIAYNRTFIMTLSGA